MILCTLGESDYAKRMDHWHNCSPRTANPFKLRRAQDLLASATATDAESDRTDSIAGDNADRAIRGVRHKLDRSLSVQYTVNELITCATDEHNLCLIFGGSSIPVGWVLSTNQGPQDGVPMRNCSLLTESAVIYASSTKPRSILCFNLIRCRVYCLLK
jgi:hypothetical protein